MDLPRIGLRLHGGMAPRRCIELARAAEAHGLASVWFAENPFHRGVLPAASACAALTQRIGIGIGVVNPYNRHPSLIAMEFAALDELAGGRALLGIGSGIHGAAARMGFADNRPLSAVRDAIHIVRGLLRGDEVSYRGRVFAVDQLKLDFPALRPDMPIHMAAMGAPGLQLCGQIADGLMISNMCPPAYTAWAVATVHAASAAAERPPPAIVQYVPCAVRPDRDAARHVVKPAIGVMLTAFWPATAAWPAPREIVVRHSGIARGEFVATLDRLRRGEPAAEVLDDRYVDAFAIAGTAAECLATAQRYRRAGVTELVLTFAGPQPEADLAYLADALAAAQSGADRGPRQANPG
jgi:5,10-methylenetetrahydromethanopterin reductase